MFGIALVLVLVALCIVSYYSVRMRLTTQTEYYEERERWHNEMQQFFDTVPSVDSSGLQ